MKKPGGLSAGEKKEKDLQPGGKGRGHHFGGKGGWRQEGNCLRFLLWERQRGRRGGGGAL